MNDRKPLGQKSYGSIAHLPGSRMGPGDHRISDGQARIATQKVRDKHDRVYVQEKLDGSCCSVAMLDDGQIVALGRAGYLASTSNFEQHHLFAYYVRNDEYKFRQLLEPGERIVGEWLAMAHGTKYDLTNRDPFVAFDLMRGTERATYLEFYGRVAGKLSTPTTLVGPTPIEDAMLWLGTGGFYGALDPVEGAVWRVEREGKVDFLAKYVRPDKVDGNYFETEVWNWSGYIEDAA